MSLHNQTLRYSPREEVERYGHSTSLYGESLYHVDFLSEFIEQGDDPHNTMEGCCAVRRDLLDATSGRSGSVVNSFFALLELYERWHFEVYYAQGYGPETGDVCDEEEAALVAKLTELRNRTLLFLASPYCCDPPFPPAIALNERVTAPAPLGPIGPESPMRQAMLRRWIDSAADTVTS